jgi:hypothetical protein
MSLLLLFPTPSISELTLKSTTETRADVALLTVIILSGKSASATRADIAISTAELIVGKSATTTRADTGLTCIIELSLSSQTTTRADLSIGVLSLSGKSSTTTRADVDLTIIIITRLTGKSSTPTRSDITVTILNFPEPAQKYVIELRTAAGALKQVFEAAYNISYTRVLNEPHTLSFNLRGTDSKRQDIRWPYEFWLRNMATGNVIRKFILTREGDSDARSNLKTTINASSLLAQLGCDLLQSDLTITDTPADIITELLTHQRLTPAITLGTVEPTDEISMTWTAGTSILACLNDMLEVIGGYFDVDNDRVLTWLNDVGDDVGKQIRQGKNIVELEKDIDWMSFATVLQVSGNGVKLSDISVDLEEATKSSDATYGYLTITQGDYVCYDIDTLKILRKGTATDYTANVAGNYGGTNWTNPSYVLNIDWTTYATWSFSAGAQESNKLGIKWNTNKVLSGCSIRCLISGSSTLLRIRIYSTIDNFSTTTLIYTGYPNYTDADGAVEFDADFGETIEVQGLAFDFAKNGTYSGYAYVFSFWGWTEYFDESGLWTNVNDRQVRIALASYHADDTYYLSYNYADFLKDLTAIATWSDEDGNGGEVSGSMSFNRADDAETLLAWAQSYLPTVSFPPTTYQLQSVLLPEVHANFADDEVDVGDIVSVIEDDLGIVVSTRILKITQLSLDLSPAEATIEISSQVKTLADAFRYLLR